MTFRPVESGVKQRKTYMDPRGYSVDGNEMGGGKPSSLFHPATKPTTGPWKRPPPPPAARAGRGRRQLLESRNHSFCTSKEGGKGSGDRPGRSWRRWNPCPHVAVLPTPLTWANDVQQDTGGSLVCRCEGVGGCLGLDGAIFQIRCPGVTSSTAVVAKQPLLGTFEPRRQLQDTDGRGNGEAAGPFGVRLQPFAFRRPTERRVRGGGGWIEAGGVKEPFS
jgi:hypothetical protein